MRRPLDLAICPFQIKDSEPCKAREDMAAEGYGGAWDGDLGAAEEDGPRAREWAGGAGEQWTGPPGAWSLP